MGTSAEYEHSDEYLKAVRLAAQGQWAEAAAVVRPLADEGDRIANVLVAQFFLNAGNPVEGKPYGLAAARAGNGLIAQNYFGNLWGHGEHRGDAIEFLELATEAGVLMDPMGYVPALVQEGHEDIALRLLRSSALPQPAPARASWEDLMARAEQDEARVKAAAEEVDAHRVRAIEGIGESEQAIAHDKERVERLVEETAQLVHGASAATLAREYGHHAEVEEKRAQRYTWAAIAGGLAAAIGTSVIAYLAFTTENGVGAVLTKGALTIPLILFAGYLARLAGQFRRKGWAWRHVELQIRTSEPFVALLDEAPRKALLAALALRFFPGQSQVPDGDVVADLGDPAQLLSSLGLNSTSASSREAASPAPGSVPS
jgi:hypothetical protein